MMEDTIIVPVSALQHWVYCPRQCALIHLEDAWTDSIFTLEGSSGHENVDEMARGVRRGVRYETSIPIWSDELGLSGRCDLVEFHPQPYPVEYKRGSAKAPRADAVQLCAQALCLEEMLGEPVPVGAMYRAQKRARTEVEITGDLRAFTLSVLDQVREMLAGDTLPPPAADQRCEKCSLQPVCLPEALTNRPAFGRHHQSLFHPEGEAP